MGGDENLGVAFALVIGAGASTAIGASVVFFPSLVKYASRKTLAAGLGLSAGVMTYVSFVEIFQKSVVGFEDSGETEERAYLYATLCFFGGVVLMVLLNIIVHSLLSGSHGHHHDHHHEPPDWDDPNDERKEEEKEEDDKSGQCPGCDNCDNNNESNNHQNKEETSESYDEDPTLPPCCAHDPAKQLSKVQDMSRQIEDEERQGIHDHRHGGLQCSSTAHQKRKDRETEDTTRTQEEEEAARLSKEETKKLHMMSLNTAIAIALHNFPEGLATFVAALSDPKVGAVLAIAIAIHNVPEGLCVAMPVYYATGNRLRAFLWALLSGVSEPIAALLGWAVLANSFSDQLYGVLFGMVSGMMVIISVRELLPTAHRYDPDDSVVTNSFMVGMGIMAVSLVLFLL